MTNRRSMKMNVGKRATTSRIAAGSKKFLGEHMNNIEMTVKIEVVKTCGIALADIKNESEIIADLGADSLDMVGLVMALEDEFGIEISDEEFEKAKTVQQIVDYVRANVKA
jgi:acyl carrier protein